MNPIAIAARGKGPFRMLKRAGAICGRYGPAPDKMDRMLDHYAGILSQFNCGATFPITAATLARSREVVEKYQPQNIEFAVHGYSHVDHTRLSLEQQLKALGKARRLFQQRGITCDGFRCPYLRWGEDTLTAVRQSSFLYDSSQALAWDVVDKAETNTYRRVLDFYGAVSARDYPALPRWDHGLVRIPYCLPDDEALLDRFPLKAAGRMSEPWLRILAETYRLGELFTLGLHPERIDLCEAPLRETLRQARALSPGVWVARLDEISRWWKARTETAVTITDGDGDEMLVRAQGPQGITLLTRGVAGKPSPAPWDGRYQRVPGAEFALRAARRPFIGASSSSSPYLKSFLRQQGYIVEPVDGDRFHTFCLNRPRFGYEDERPLLAQIDQGDFPLVRLGRWPHGARSALCVTGDIDALTIWDYGLRFLGM